MSQKGFSKILPAGIGKEYKILVYTLRGGGRQRHSVEIKVIYNMAK